MYGCCHSQFSQFVYIVIYFLSRLLLIFKHSYQSRARAALIFRLILHMCH